MLLNPLQMAVGIRKLFTEVVPLSAKRQNADFCLDVINEHSCCDVCYGRTRTCDLGSAASGFSE
jgi:hypothetical protein